MGCGQNVGSENSAGDQIAKIADIVKRVTRPPEGQECWELRKSGGCTNCGGFGTEEALACGPHCRLTDHRSCGTKLIPCLFCAGTGLGVMELFRLLGQIGCIVNVDVKLPGGQYLKE